MTLSPFLVAVLLLLGTLAPEQHLAVVQYPIVEETRPLSGATAWATLGDGKSHIVTEVYKGWYAEAKLNQQWTACTLVHEAMHLLLRTRDELMVLPWQYMCLDSLGAPWWMKQHIRDLAYGLLHAKLNRGGDDG